MVPEQLALLFSVFWLNAGMCGKVWFYTAMHHAIVKCTYRMCSCFVRALCSILLLG